MSKPYWLSAVLVLLFAAGSAGPAHAKCGISSRISHKDSDCLTAKWDNAANWLSINKYQVKNECSDLGTVFAKLDVKNWQDLTEELSDDQWEKGSTDLLNIRHIYCCSDLSDLCNRSDIEDDN